MFAWGFWSLSTCPSFGWPLRVMQILHLAPRILLQSTPSLSKKRSKPFQTQHGPGLRISNLQVVVLKQAAYSFNKSEDFRAEVSSKPHLTPQTSGPSSSCGDEVLTSRRVPHAFCRDPQCGHGDSGACPLRSPIAYETMRLQLSRLQHVLCKRLATLLCGN